jgi:hypothetical protein
MNAGGIGIALRRHDHVYAGLHMSVRACVFGIGKIIELLLLLSCSCDLSALK